jgi:predicted DNA-binding protein (UPF0251 family)
MYGVLTGDLVRSKALERDRPRVLSVLKRAFKAATSIEQAPGEFALFSRIFRGDSFQVVISNPARTLKVALFLRARLLMIRLPAGRPDTRVGLGIGTIGSLNKSRIEESDGEAFRYSGRALDGLKGYRRLALVSAWTDLNRRFEPLLSSLDAIILHWTPEQAEAMSFMLQGWRQREIARRLGVKQPAVQQRLLKAGHFAVSDCLSYFEASVLQYKSEAL